MAQDDEPRGDWIGREVFDVDGAKIGTVDEVRYDDALAEPLWVVVKSGLLGRSRSYLPAGEIRQAGDRLSVPYTKERVKDAPEVEDEQVLTESEKGRLCRYYGLQYVSGAPGSGEGCEEMQDSRPAG